MEKFKIAIIGSRQFHDYDFIEQSILNKISLNEISCVISGAAKGVDALAVEFAGKHGLEMIEFPAQWEIYGKQAGYLRNTTIVENADIIFAFPMGVSNGTRDSIIKAREMNKVVYVYEIDRYKDKEKNLC